MSQVSDRERLLGLVRWNPPEVLRQKSKFKTPEEYKAFLSETQQHPESYWKTLSAELVWEKSPSSIGRPGDWFPGGKLNMCRQCLDRFVAPSTESAVVVTGISGRGLVETTRADLQRKVAVLCKRLLAIHLQPGQRVLLKLMPDGDGVAAILACLRLGLVGVPCDASMDGNRLTRRAEDAYCRAEIASPAFLTERSEILDPVGERIVLESGWDAGPSDLAAHVPVEPMSPSFLVADSSGQLFSLPTAGFLLQAISAYRVLMNGRGIGDRLGIRTPMHHASFLAALLGALASGGEVAVLPQDAVSSMADVRNTMEVSRPRVWLVQSKCFLKLAGSLLSQGEKTSVAGPELLVLEGETVEPGLYQALHDTVFGGRTHVVQVLSRPEVGGFLAGPCSSITPVRPASVALSAPGFDLKVVDDRGQDAPINRGGLMAIKTVTPGTAIELQQTKPPLIIGVQARVDREGFFWSMGEVQVDRPEENDVALPEQEAFIASMKGVEQVAVVRFQDRDGKWRARVFVKQSEGACGVEEIRRRLEERFGAQAAPEDIQLVSGLPYSRTGKLLRSVLRRIAQGEVDGLGDVGTVADPEVVQHIVMGRMIPSTKGENGGSKSGG
jgi:acetyl-CoA synthetase